jgi:hypothetical protein
MGLVGAHPLGLELGPLRPRATAEVDQGEAALLLQREDQGVGGAAVLLVEGAHPQEVETITGRHERREPPQRSEGQ